MLFDDPAYFRFDRIPVRPRRRLWRPNLSSASRPFGVVARRVRKEDG